MPMVFKEITIGGLSKAALLQQMSKAGIQFNPFAEALFEHPDFCPSEKSQKVALAKIKISDLGLSHPCSFQDILNRASDLGWNPCPLYLAAYLRLEYLEQPEGPYLTIVSAKLDKEFPNGFYLRNHENKLWLRGYKADDFCEWPPENEFVFMKLMPD